MRAVEPSLNHLFVALESDAAGNPYALPDALDVYVREVVRRVGVELEAASPGAARQWDAALRRSSAGGLLRRDFSRSLPAELTTKILKELDGPALYSLSQCSRFARSAVLDLLSPGHMQWLSQPIKKIQVHARLDNAKHGGPLLPCPADSRRRVHAHAGALTLYELDGDGLTAVHMWSPSVLGGAPTGAATWAPDGRGVAAVCNEGEQQTVSVVDAHDASVAPVTLVPAPALGKVVALAWAANPAYYLAVVGTRGTAVYDLRTAESHLFGISCHVAPYYAHKVARWACTEPYLALSDAEGVLQVWDLRKPEEPKPALAPLNRIRATPALAWHPRRSELVADRCNVHLMRMGREDYVDSVETPTLLPSNNYVTHNVQVAFEPRGRDALLAVVYDSNIALCAPAQHGLRPLRHLESQGYCVADWMLWTDDNAIEFGTSGAWAWAVHRLLAGPGEPRTGAA